MLAFWSVAPFHADIWWDWKGFSLLVDCDWCVSRGHPVTWSLVLSRGYTMESFQVSAWSLLSPTPSNFFFFLNVSSVLLYSASTFESTLFGWSQQKKEEKKLEERKEYGSNLPHSSFVVLLFLRSLLQLCWTAHRITDSKGRGSDTDGVEMKRNRGEGLSAVCELVSSGWRRPRLVGHSLQSSHSSSWKYSWRSQITLLQEANQLAPIRAT